MGKQRQKRGHEAIAPTLPLDPESDLDLRLSLALRAALASATMGGT